MPTFQKTVITAAFITAIGAGLYEARQAAKLHAQVQSLQQQMAPLDDQINQLTRDREDALRQLAALREENKLLSQNTEALPRLRSEVTRLNAAAKPTTVTTEESAAKSWLARVDLLKQKLKETPGASIPELQLLTEEDWLEAVKDRNLSSEKDYRRAFSTLRNTAESKVAVQMQPALKHYMEANNGEFPSDVSQLQSYFTSPLDEAILQRYRVLPAEEISSLGMGGDKIISVKTPVDSEYDNRYGIGPNGWGSAGPHSWNDTFTKDVKILGPAMKAYSAANNGKEPTSPEQIVPYITTVEEQAALQRFVKRTKEAQASASK